MLLLEKEIKEKLSIISKKFVASEGQQNIFAEYREKSSIRIIAQSLQNNQESRTEIINIEGVLTEKPDIIAMFFGGGNTTYSDIIEKLNTANGDSNIDNIQLNINSPGGQVNGIFDVLETLNKINKPIVAKIYNWAASAAYMIAANTDSIIANNKAVRVGSIGVAADIPIDNNIVEIASSNAPAKRPDITTSEGQEIIRKQLDDLEALMLDSIANGRNTTIDNVKQNYGRGGLLIAEDAKNQGMLDKILGQDIINKNINQNNNFNQKTGAKTMELEELKAQNPGLFKEIMEAGIKQERDRVVGHLTIGQASGNIQIAIDAITDGSEMNNTLQAKYMAAALNKKDLNARIEDNPAMVAPNEDADTSMADMIMNAIEDKMGLNKKNKK